jgi:predicted GIY-YIG superfamily endonuclease
VSAQDSNSQNTNYIVYLAINQTDGKKYVGYTKKKLSVRKARHESDARNGSNFYFHNALRKHGSRHFKWYVIAWPETIEEAEAFEIAHIRFYRQIGEPLLNSTNGGEGVTNLPEESRQRMREGASIGGRIGGRKSVESGHWDRIRTPEHQRKGGLAAGRRNVQSGHVEWMASLPQTKAAQSRNGKLQGRKAVESGRLASVRTPETCAKGGRIACHQRWHVSRNITKSDCILCNPQN